MIFFACRETIRFFQIDAIISFNRGLLILAVDFRFWKKVWSRPLKLLDDPNRWVSKGCNWMAREFSRSLLYKVDLITFKSFSRIFSTQMPEPTEVFFFSSSETPKNFQRFLSSNLLPFVSYSQWLFTGITVGCPSAALGTSPASLLLRWLHSYFDNLKVNL